MKISLKWLNDYIDVKEFFEKPEELDRILTAAGLEVENIENRAKDYNHLVVGHLTTVGKHPDADKLTVCTVDLGGGKSSQIVCGAKNHKQGDKVVAALPGAVLPGNFKIKKSKIRGVESLGMLCSESELGLAEKSEGILILPEDAPVGEAFAPYFGFDDIVFELSVTPNRADCLSHYGLARELSCLLDRECQFDGGQVAESNHSTKSEIELSVLESDLCPRYTGRFLRGVKVQESPAWLKRRVESVGLNSINNVVDVTNYVMMELGQPLHAFDVRFLDERKIVVERAKAGEKFTTLDSTEVELTGEELVIRDGKKVVALAGVVGGLNSGVRTDTTDLFIESAYFTQATVRKTSRKFGIETDSAYRFSRGVDPENTFNVMNRCCELILKVAGGEAFGEPYDIYPSPLKKKTIEIETPFISQKLGYEIDDSRFENYMNRLGCQVDKLGIQKYAILPPAYRWDLELAEDLIEEYGRLNGYDQIPERLPITDISPSSHDTEYLFHQRVADIFTFQGFYQALNYGFISSKYQEKILGDFKTVNELGLHTAPEAVSILNPLNEELDVMRLSMVPWLLKNVEHNTHHGNLYGRLFETGFTFEKSDNKYQQYSRLGLVAWGQSASLWGETKNPVVMNLKTSVEALLKNLKITSFRWEQVTEGLPHFIHSGQCAVLIVEGKKVGFVGTVHPLLKQEYKLRVDSAVAELDLDLLGRGQPRPLRAKSISKFPMVERDLAFVMPTELSAGQVSESIRKAGGKALQSIEIFDVYEGDKLEAGQKSVAYRMIFQDLEGTLDENQILALQDKIIQSVERQFSITMR